MYTYALLSHIVKQSSTQKLTLRLFASPASPVPHLAPFGGGGRGYPSFIGILSPPPGAYAISLDVITWLPPSGLIGERSGASRMHSRVPGVKPKGYTAGYPYPQWRRQHPTADGNMSCGYRHSWTPGQASFLLIASSCSMCSCRLLFFWGRTPI